MTHPQHLRARRRANRDNGSVLPLVLVLTIVLSLVVISIANYVATGLRFGKVVEAKADRLAAADAGLRYGVERLQLQSYAPCITGLGDSGYTIDFPFNVNNATVDVSCRKDGNGFSDIQSWAIVVTGEGVPNGQWHLHSQGGGGVQKLLGGPVYVSQPDKISLQAPVTVEDGDIWYSSTDCNGPVPAVDLDLTFKPAFRGLMCVQAPWTALYSTPAANVPTNLPALPYLDGSCNVFSPGKYLAMPILGANNYFKSGEYYFENVPINIQNAVVTAGWADFDRYGDQQFLANGPCAGAISADALSGSQAGATFYLGGTSKIEVSNKGKLEILRRRQGVNVVSVQALETVGPGYIPSTVSWNTSIMWTKSGANTDLAVHGLAWAPRSLMTFGNITNNANGQLLGGAAFARIDLQASASASNFIIRVEGSPAAYTLILEANAQLDGQSTLMRAVVQVDDVGVTAVNSWRVVE